MNSRPAIPADLPALNQLVNSAYRGESSRVGWTTEADLLDGIRTSEPALQQMLENPAATILVLEENAQLIACVYLEKMRQTLYLGMLTVKPALQGRGLGATLLQDAEDVARQWGCRNIQMTVITQRHSLIAYYQRKGYADTGERKPFPSDPAFGLPKQPLQFLVMEKQINPL